MSYDWLRIAVQPPIYRLERIIPPVAGPSGVFTRWVFPHQASCAVQLPAASLSIIEPTRLRLRAQENIAETSSIYGDQEDNDTIDVLHRAVRNAGRARSPISAPNIYTDISLTDGLQTNFPLTAFTTSRFSVSVVYC